MKTIIVTSLLAALAGTGVHSVSAQDRSKEERTAVENKNERTSATPDATLDNQLAHCLAIDNWVEIEVAKFAAGKAQSDEAKRFAETVQKEHLQFVTRLKEVEPKIDAFLSRDAKHADRKSDLNQGNVDPTAKEAGRERQVNPLPVGQQADSRRELNGSANRESLARENADGSPMLKIKQEVAETCVGTITQELETKSAAEFDRCFLGYQVGAHLRMLDTLKVFERHASPGLAKTIGEATEMTQEHLVQAKKLLAQFDANVARVNKGSVEVK